MHVEARKFKADAQGEEREVPVNDWIEVGALATPAKGQKNGEVLARQRVHMASGASTYSFVTGKQPDKAGIDPLLLLVDRVPEDNLHNVTVVQ